MMTRAEQLAQFFYESYERLAPQFGYETRKESAKPWADVPEQNRKLVTAVCAEVLAHAAAQLAEKEREIERLQRLLDGKQANHGRLHPESPLICFHCGNRVPVSFNQCTDCKEAAEQRLQEAQARIKERELQNEIAKKNDWRKLAESNQGTATKALERLRQREAELEQRWIAVEDKLPDAEGKVLVLRSNDHPKIDLEWYTKRGRWDSGFFHDGEQDTNVTHWQPLPSPPKEG